VIGESTQEGGSHSPSPEAPGPHSVSSRQACAGPSMPTPGLQQHLLSARGQHQVNDNIYCQHRGPTPNQRQYLLSA